MEPKGINLVTYDVNPQGSQSPTLGKEKENDWNIYFNGPKFEVCFLRIKEA